MSGATGRTLEDIRQSAEIPPYVNEPWFRELREKMRDWEAKRGYLDYPPPPDYLDAGDWAPSTHAGQKVMDRVPPEPVVPLDPAFEAALNTVKLSLDEMFSTRFVVAYGVYSGPGRGTPEGLKLREVAAMLDWARRWEWKYGFHFPGVWLAADPRAGAVKKILARAYVKLDRAVRTIRPPRRSEAPRRVRFRPPAVLILLFSEIEDLFYAARSGRPRDRRALVEAIRRLAR